MEAADNPRTASRPRIGLALGGGVARGWAHIGAVRRLQELGVAPDVVCGTSVGALVGGFWLAGELDALEGWARSLNKRRMLAYFDLMLNGAGLMGGRRLERAMREYLGDLRIVDLPAKFLAVTAELATGQEIWLDEGPLCESIEAAYALPGVFPPRAVNGRWLIDGALVNPLPVSACRALGARVVIAIGLHADAFGRAAAQRRARYEIAHFAHDAEDTPRGLAEAVLLRRFFRTDDATPGMGSVMLAAFNIIMDRITRSRLAGDPPDVLITPQVGHVPLLDFDKADELIALGRAAVDAQAESIEAALSYFLI